MLTADSIINLYHWNYILLLAAMALSVAGMVVLRRKATPLAFLTMSCIFTFLLGFTLFTHKYEMVRHSIHESSRAFSGQVISTPQEKPKTWAVKVRTDKGATLLAYVRKAGSQDPLPPLHLGDYCTLRANSVSPTCIYDLPDTAYMSYRRYLFYSGISATAFVDKSEKSDDKPSLPFYYGMQERLSALYHSRGITGEEGAIIEAMTIGNKQDLTPELRRQYSRAGISHILALSGYHLTLIYAILELLLFGKIVTRRWRWISSVIILACLWLFALITGMSPSLTRATIMCSIMILSKIFYQESFSLNSLAFAAIVMLCINPLQVFDIGFELSFMSILGIIIIGKPVCDSLSGKSFTDSKWKGILPKALGIIVITISCTLFTAPLVAYYFHQIPLLSVFTNLVISILTPLIMTMSIFWWMLWPLQGVQHLVTGILVWLVSAMNVTTGFVASMQWSTIEWQPNLLAVILFYVLLWAVIRIFCYLCKFKRQIISI